MVLDAIFRYVLSDGKSWHKNDAVLGMTDFILPQIFITFKGLGLESFRLQSISDVNFWLTIRVVKLYRSLFPFSSLLPVMSQYSRG